MRVSSKLRAGASVLDGLYQSGCLKLLFPRAQADALTGVFLNTAGGLTGGDRISLDARAGAGSRLTLTSQAAERCYKATGETVALMSTELTVEAEARLDWLPQETILFDQSALRRRLCVQMAPDARFLMVEPLVLGRLAMGEVMRSGLFQDSVRVSRGTDLVFADAVRLSGDIPAMLRGSATADGAGAMASVLYVGPDAEAHLAALRSLMPATGGTSLLRPGVLYARLLAPDSFLLRRSLIPVIGQLHGRALPKTWMM
ncbi:MAG: urease accessory protein UreD [Pseudorhodobacter sp.]|nr:urease accessory protein UreD [Pseudorhodobacter sp.]